MANVAQVRELIQRWQTLRRQGKTISAEELCRDCPELVPEVSHQMQLLTRLEALLTRWHELKQRGQQVTPEELCRNSPELLAALKHQIKLREAAPPPGPPLPPPPPPATVAHHTPNADTPGGHRPPGAAPGKPSSNPAPSRSRGSALCSA